MSLPRYIDDNYLVQQLQKDDRKIFEVIFNCYYSGLVIYADKILDDINLSEDVVQSVYMKLWETRKKLAIQSLRAYLATAVKNRCIDLIRTQKVKNKFLDKSTREISSEITDDFITYNELSEIITRSVAKLPPRCKEIFEMSRFQYLKVKEIADLLNISNRTVETQISKALKILRVELKDHLPYLMFILFF